MLFSKVSLYLALAMQTTSNTNQLMKQGIKMMERDMSTEYAFSHVSNFRSMSALQTEGYEPAALNGAPVFAFNQIPCQ